MTIPQGRGRAREPKQPLPLHERALGLLAVRQRSRRELRSRLLRAGFEAVAVDEELTALESVGLIDDDAFARSVVEQAAGRRLQGRRAVASALSAKGVDRGTIERALDELDGPGEEERAFALARTRASRLVGAPPEAAARRLTDFLARRGYAPGLARRAAAAALSVDPDPADA
ncbi:MAG: regulatory protein RecX [Actinomycetota bacterium]